MTDLNCDIILPVCDQFDFTKNCIDSMIAHTTTPYRLIVINNGTNEKTASYLAKVKTKLGDRLVVIKNPTNIGWVKALNQGFAIARAPFICFQNDDTVVTHGWLEKMIAILKAHPEIGLVNPSWEGRPEYVSINDYGCMLEKRHKGEFMETDWARGFSVVLKKEVIDKIGNIDDIYGLAYFDDVDFSVRAVNAGFLVVLALDTYVYHHRNATFFEILKGKRWNELHEKNKRIYHSKWGRPLKVALILDREACADERSLRRAEETVYYLARRQHHIDVWAPADIARRIRHTNVAFRSYGPRLTRPAALIDLYINGTKRPEKRYSGIFSFDRAFGGFLKRSGLAGGAPVYAKAPDGDFDEFVRRRVDDMKEKTKEEYRDAQG